MKYLFALLFSLSFVQFTNAQTERIERRAEVNEAELMYRSEEIAKKEFAISLDRYAEAVRILDQESQDIILRDIIIHMEKMVKAEKYRLKDVEQGKQAEAKTAVTEKNRLIKQIQASDDSQQILRMLEKF